MDDQFRVNLTKSGLGIGLSNNLDTYEYSHSVHVPSSPGKLLPEKRVVEERLAEVHDIGNTEVFNTDNEKTTTPLLSISKNK